MLNTTRTALNPTAAPDAEECRQSVDHKLMGRYENIVHQQRLNWTTHHRLQRVLGEGGQGVVFLSERRGADNFTLPVAIKIFSPERFATGEEYERSMARMAAVAAHVAQIQHDCLLDVHNFIDRNRIRGMVMEWIDGYDLRQLLSPNLLANAREHVTPQRWEYLNRVLITPGSEQSRFKPGAAVAIVRDCLAALAALHRHGVVHSDIKPANIMLKRTGAVKIVDIGSAFRIDDPPKTRTCTLTYAAPEVLEGQQATPRSDLASLGYVLIELLAGRRLFSESKGINEVLEARRTLPYRLSEILPSEITENDLLMHFCLGLIAPDPATRFASAEAAELMENEGAAAFHRQLVISNLASEYDNELRLWLEELKAFDLLDAPEETV